MASTTYLQQAYLAYFGRPADVSGLSFYADKSEAQVVAAFSASAESQAFFGSLNTLAQINTIYQNLFNRPAEPAGLTYWAGEINSGRLSLAQASMGILAGAQNADKLAVTNKLAAATAFTAALDTSEEMIGYQGTAVITSARAFLASVDSTAASLTAATAKAALDASVSTVVTAGAAAASASSGSTFTLTTGVDNYPGASGNNTIDGSRAIIGGTAFDTLNSSDIIDGGGGTDTLFVQLTGNATTTTPNTIKNVEVLTVENLGAGVNIIDLSNGDTSLKTLNINNSTTAGVTVQNNPTAFTALGISNVNQAITLTSIATAIAGTTDSIVINLTSATGAAGITNAGYETVTINSNGNVANSIGAYTNSSATRLNIGGSQNLTMTSANTALVTVDASTAAGRVAFTTSATSNIAITGGSAADTFTLGSTYTTSDTINGGAGSDILSIDNATAILATTSQTNVTNMETLSISTANTTGAISLVNWGVTGLNLTTTSAAALTASYAAGTNSLNLGSVAQTGGVTVNVAGVATNDVLNLAMATSSTGAGAAHTTGFTSNGVETINLSTTGTSASSYAGTFVMTNTAATESLIITGNQNMTFTGNITADVVNASGMTGTALLSMVGGGANSMTITGTANNDQLIGGTAADIITAGAGDDVVQNAVSGANSIAADVLTGGTGNDTFRLIGTAAATATNYNGVTFVSDFTVGSAATNTDVLSIDVTNATYGTSKAAQGATDVALTATAAGSTTIQSVAQNAAATALTANTQLIKLSTGVAFTTDVQGTFNAAIGSATLTAAIAASDYFAMYYDTTNARAVLINVDSGNIIIGTGDTVVLVGTIAMTAADYASFGANQFSLVDY